MGLIKLTTMSSICCFGRVQEKERPCYYLISYNG